MKKYFKLLLEGSREYDPYDQRGSYFIHTKTHERVYSPGNTHAETVDELSDKFNYTSNPSHSPEDMVHHALRQGWVRIGQNTYNDSNGRGSDFYLQGNTEHELQSVVKFMGRGLKGTKFSLLIDKPLAPLSHHTDTHTYDTDTILDERDLERYTTHGHRIKPIEMTQNKSFVFNTALSVAPRTNRNTTNPSYVYKTIGDNYDPTLQERWSEYEVEKELRRTVPESQRTFESFTFSKLITQLNEEHDDLIDEMHPIMYIHTDPTISTYHVVAGDTNRKTHNELAKDAIEDHYTKRPSGNLSDQLLSLGPWTRIHTYPAPRVLGIIGQKSFEIEAASHETLRDTLGRIEPHISGHKVHIAVRDFASGGEWSKRVDAEQLRDYIKHGHQARSLRVESWQEYDAKVGETNTSLFEPGNTKFNMKAFLKKLRKKNGVGVNLPGEN